MASSARSADVAPSAGWGELFMRALKIVVVGFVVLQAKEYYDAGMFDTVATLVDAALIAAGVLIVDAVLKKVKG
jgi:hypothetical protein